jgi:PAS domain S-box-containing protein
MTFVIRHWLAACCLLLIAGPIHAQEQIKIGIQAYRPKPQTLSQWAPLGAALNKALPGYNFVIEVYDVDELADAVASRKIDFILTNPSQFVLMNHRSGLSAPLASLNNIEQGKSVSSFGGVIFTLASHKDIQKLEDVRGKSVAIISPNSFGGYQMQAYEFYLAGLRIPQDIRLITIKPPQDNIVDAVLSGRADVGFVRSGVLESMTREGLLDRTRIKIINRQNLPGFPTEISTRLYPEWFFASMPHTDKELRRKVVSFLLNIEEGKALTQALKIRGFDVPGDSTSVEEMLRELRMPPFDVMPAVTVRDIWEHYRLAIIVSFVAAGLLLLLGFRLLISNRRLKIERGRVQMQADKLKESNNLLDSIVENIPNMIFLKRASDLRFELFNRAGEILLGCDRDKLLGINDYDLFPKEQADSFTRIDRAVLAQNNIVDIPEEPIETPHGTRILHTKKLILRDDKGQPLHLLGISEDITERMRAEEAQRRLNRELRAISNCNGTLMRADDEQALLDDICHIVCDDAGYRMAWVGYTENDADKSIRTIACAGVDEGFLDQAKFLWADTERGRSSSGIAIRSGNSVIVKDVQLDPDIAIWREEALQRDYHSGVSLPLKDAGGATFGVLGIFSDRPNAFTPEEVRLLEELAGDMAFGITVLRTRIERNQAEAEILRLNQELEQRVADRTTQLEAANKELEAFSYSVSHDLRTPLRAIDGFSHILLEDYTDKLDDEGKRLLNVVRDNTSRMGQLIDDILKFSRTGRLELTFAEIDMERLAHEVFEELQPSVTGRKLQLEIEPIPAVTGDRTMMRQVFVNLLSNAIKFSRPKEAARIKVGGSIEGNEAIYYVKDNGVGFDMQYVDKLFGVFQRLHSVDEFEGTGIGLSIVKRIITRHGGRVWAEGKVNEGATIYFALPIRENNHENVV